MPYLFSQRGISRDKRLSFTQVVDVAKTPTSIASGGIPLRSLSFPSSQRSFVHSALIIAFSVFSLFQASFLHVFFICFLISFFPLSYNKTNCFVPHSWPSIGVDRAKARGSANPSSFSRRLRWIASHLMVPISQSTIGHTTSIVTYYIIMQFECYV